MDLVWLRKRISSAGTPALEKLSTMSSLIDETIRQVRRIATGLRPGILDDLGLLPSIEWQARDFQNRSGIVCAVSSDIDRIPLDNERITAIFRIFQEALTNVARHAEATRVDVRLRENGEALILEVHDDGVGIDDCKVTTVPSLGLLGMKERATVFDGKVTIGPGPNGGTSVVIIIPIQR